MIFLVAGEPLSIGNERRWPHGRCRTLSIGYALARIRVNLALQRAPRRSGHSFWSTPCLVTGVPAEALAERLGPECSDPPPGTK